LINISIISGGSTTENLFLEEIESLKKANEKDKADLMTQLNNQLQNEKAAYEEMFRKQKQEMRQIIYEKGKSIVMSH
jgi:dsDNA-specific endonuclease/ATPase MutS2